MIDDEALTEEQIVQMVLARYEDLRQLPREQLHVEFETAFSFPASPRLSTEFLIKLLARGSWDELRLQHVGWLTAPIGLLFLPQDGLIP